MVKGFVTNNTGRSRHIFKQTIYPGQKISLEKVYSLVANKVPDNQTFVEWLEGSLPEGWEINITPKEKLSVSGGREYKETLTAIPEVIQEEKQEVSSTDLEEDDGSPSREFSTPRAIDKFTAKDIYNLRLKDNPRRIIKNVYSIYKLRRALTLCKNDSRKATLIRLIQGRIKELNATL